MVARSVLMGMLSVVALTAHANADCSVSGLVAKVATPLDTTLVGGGGFLVAAVSEPTGALANGDAAFVPSWKLAGGKTPKTTSIAPGLLVYEAPFVDQVTPVELFDGAGKVIGRVVGSKAKVAVFAAPKIKTITLNHPVSRRIREAVTVELDGPAPRDAYAIVIADAKGTARSWSVIARDATTLTPYIVHECQALPNKTVPSKSGDKVTLFFVNAHGRTSERTQTMTIKSPPKP